MFLTGKAFEFYKDRGKKFVKVLKPHHSQVILILTQTMRQFKKAAIKFAL